MKGKIVSGNRIFRNPESRRKEEPVMEIEA